MRAIEKANAEVTIPLEKMSTEKIAEIAQIMMENAGRDRQLRKLYKVEDSLMIGRLLHAGKVIYHLQI